MIARSNKDFSITENAKRARAELQSAVGERVRAVRLERGIGQAECARAAGLDTSSLFRLEKGDQNATVETLGRIALVLGVELIDLVAGVSIDAALIDRPISR